MKTSTAFLLATTCTASLLVTTPAAAVEANENRCTVLSQAVRDASAALQTTQSEERAAQQELAQAQEALRAAERDEQTAANLIPTAQQALETARTQLANTPNPGLSAQQAQQQLSAAQQQLAQAQAELDASKEKAQQQFDRGSLGFFEAMGARDAVAELNTDFRFEKVDPLTGQSGYRIANDTHIGDPQDATHLDNMKAAISYLPEGNRLRVSEGQPALPVTDFLMAQAQVNVNFSQRDVRRGHSSNGWDNLSWGTNSPYEGWFHHERPLYFDAIKQGRDPFAAGAGHYMAIVNPKMRATGYALTTRSNRYRGAHSQTFSPELEKLGKTFTVEEYTQRFNTYYDGLKDAIVNGDATKRAAVAQEEQAQAQAQRALEAAEAYAAAQELVAQREQELTDAKQQQAARLAAATQARAEAAQRQQRAAEAAQQLGARLTAAQATLAQAEAEYAPLKAECEPASDSTEGSSTDSSGNGSSGNDEGSSTGGIIAGVVVALLAVVGIAVTLNPQLMVTLQ